MGAQQHDAAMYPQKLLTVKEIGTIGKSCAYSIHHGCLWLEVYGGGVAPCFPDCIAQGELRVYSPYYLSSNDETLTWWPLASYGSMWRMWTEKPTEQQRRETEWQDV